MPHGNPQLKMSILLENARIVADLENTIDRQLEELTALKTLIRMMAETLLFYSERGGGRARDLYRHPLTQQVLDEAGYYEVKVQTIPEPEEEELTEEAKNRYNSLVKAGLIHPEVK